MENASKALIIAGAILIAILLITIGIVLINSGRNVAETGTTGMQSKNIQIFNAPFTEYAGTKKGSDIRDIFNAVNASNATDEEHQIRITGITRANDLVLTRTYTVTLTYHGVDDELNAHTDRASERGYICTINIQ